VHLNLFVIDGTESIEFSIIKFDFIFTTDSFDGTTKSFDNDGYFIQVNNNVFVERLAFVLEVSDFLRDLLHSTVFHVTLVTFETNFLLQHRFDVGVTDE